MSIELSQAVDSFTSATEVLTAAGLDISGQDNIGILVSNTGVTNAITGLSVYWSNDAAGTRWSVADADIAAQFAAAGSSIAASTGTFRIERTGTVAKRVRITLTSVSGTTATVDVLAYQTAVRL